MSLKNDPDCKAFSPTDREKRKTGQAKRAKSSGTFECLHFLFREDLPVAEVDNGNGFVMQQTEQLHHLAAVPGIEAMRPDSERAVQPFINWGFGVLDSWVIWRNGELKTRAS